MPSPLRRFLRPIVLAALALGLFAPALPAGPKVGILLKGTTDFWAAVARGAVEAGKNAGIETVVQMPPAESDIDIQIKMVDAMSRQGIQALIIAPCSTTALSGPIAAVAARGIKVVVVDTALDGEMPVFIATNHTDAGAAAGQLLARHVQDGDEISFLKHLQTSSATTLREVSAYAELRRAHADLTIDRDIFCGAEPGKELDKARLLLSRHPDTKAIFASSTPGSMAMLKALREAHRKIPFVGVGFNLNKTVAAALADGTMLGWIAQLPDEIGRKGMNAAVALLDGEPVTEVTFCDFLVITKYNLDDPLVQGLMSP